jgi:hypothetical protein
MICEIFSDAAVPGFPTGDASDITRISDLAHV